MNRLIRIAAIMGAVGAGFYFAKRYNSTRIVKNNPELLLGYSEHRFMELKGPEIPISLLSRAIVEEALDKTTEISLAKKDRIRASLPALDSDPKTLEKFSSLFVHDGSEGLAMFTRTDIGQEVTDTNGISTRKSKHFPVVCLRTIRLQQLD